MNRTNEVKVLVSLEKKGKKNKEAIWLALAKQLGKNRSGKTVVNLSKLQNLSKKIGDKTIVVPGKVLGSGKISKAISVAALEYSGSAKKKILEAKGKAITLSELAETNPKKSSLVIVK